MNSTDVRQRAFAMPLTSPAYPPGPYRFVDREYLIITYRSDPEKLRAVVPEPLEVDEPLVKYEFIRMPGSTGFGDYTETGQVIPVSFEGRRGGYTHCMFLNDEGPIAGGRELWGFPKKLAAPSLTKQVDTLVGTLDYGPGAGGDGHHGLQAPDGRPRRGAGGDGGAKLPAEDHPARRPKRPYLRARRIPAPGHRPEGRLDRARARWRSCRTRWRRSPSCQCWRSSPPSTSSPT